MVKPQMNGALGRTTLLSGEFRFLESTNGTNDIHFGFRVYRAICQIDPHGLGQTGRNTT